MLSAKALSKSIISRRAVPAQSTVRSFAAKTGDVPRPGVPDDRSYTERQQMLGRPTSPHVQIYKFPPAAISSITNRFTGIGLSTGIRILYRRSCEIR
jgi:hypothetical protein